ncbi:diguanylate cyclase [Buttiauxella sp.]|uniref:diguanylate cyclase n=1 Tax=Buttiauxella sp. TaxID=1972222 RepID=UPI003C74B1C3
MNFSITRLRACTSGLLSSLANKRWLLLALFVQGMAATSYLYLERNGIETGVVQSLKNVSAMHLRSFEQLENTIRYQLLTVGERMLANSRIDSGSQNDNSRLKTEIGHPWLDTVIVLDPTGNIVASDSTVPLASILPASVLKSHSFKGLPQYQSFYKGLGSSFFVPRHYASEAGSKGLVMYQTISSREGEILGSVVGYTKLNSLSSLLRTDITRGFDLGKDGILALLDNRTDDVLYRYSYAQDPINKNHSDSGVIAKAHFRDTKYGPNVKFYRSPIDGVERLAVLQPLHQGQWLQLTAQSKNVYEFYWQRQVVISILLFACLAVLQWLLMSAYQRSRQQRLLLDLVLDSVDACVYFKTSERHFAYVNAKTAELFGLRAEKIIGKRDSEVLPQKMADDFWITDSKVLTAGSKQMCTEIVTNPQGETRYYSSIKVPVQLPGQLPALVGISNDVTELHQQTLAREAAEIELAAHNHSLLLHNIVLEKLGDNTPLSEVLDTMVRIINDYRPGMMSTVLLLDDDGKTLIGCAGPDLPEAWWSNSARLPVKEGYGSAVTAVLRGETVIAEDIAIHPCWAALREVACGQGLRAAWAQPVKDNEGRILGVFGMYKREPATPDTHDLALLEDYARLAQMAIERARMAVALQESQALYRLIAENSNDLIWVMKYPFLTCSYVSPSAERIRGWTAEEIMEQQLEEMVSEDSVRLIQETLQDCMQRISEGDLSGQFFSMELEHLHKDGRVVPVEAKGTIMLDSEGKPSHIIGNTRDITKRRAAENALHLAREQLADQLLFAQTLINAIPNPVFAKDLTGRYMMCNTAYEEYKGKSHQQILGKNVFDLCPREMAEVHSEADRALFDNPHSQMYEAKAVYRDGSQRDALFNRAVFRNSNKEVAGLVGVMLDITQRKAAEEVIRNMAFFDQLTGLPNRRMMEDRLSQMLALAKREQRKLSLLFVDLDKFKAVNDQHGHQAGDWLLPQVAYRMSAQLRLSDTVSRIGGDEFVILLPDTHTTEDAVLVAEKIRAVLELPFVMENDVVLEISSSIGVVMYPDQADTVRDLLHFGDEAMYRAKKNGRNAVEVFDHPLL